MQQCGDVLCGGGGVVFVCFKQKLRISVELSPYFVAAVRLPCRTGAGQVIWQRQMGSATTRAREGHSPALSTCTGPCNTPILHNTQCEPGPSISWPVETTLLLPTRQDPILGLQITTRQPTFLEAHFIILQHDN